MTITVNMQNEDGNYFYDDDNDFICQPYATVSKQMGRVL